MVEWVGPLRSDQTAHAVVWHSTLTRLGQRARMPLLGPEWFTAFWGDSKTTKRLKTWGHATAGDRTSPHFLCSRGGTPLHTDPAYARYALQVQLCNQGFVVHGLADKVADMPLFEPGLVIVLDTWSPHIVERDPRLPQTGHSKVLVGSDFVAMPDIAAALPPLVAHIARFALPQRNA